MTLPIVRNEFGPNSTQKLAIELGNVILDSKKIKKFLAVRVLLLPPLVQNVSNLIIKLSDPSFCCIRPFLLPPSPPSPVLIPNKLKKKMKDKHEGIINEDWPRPHPQVNLG
jgi:hypothetical protein